MLSQTSKDTHLLQQPLNTDLLQFLTLDVQIQVISLITKNALQNIQKISEELPTDDHIKWLMEVCGKGYSLPLTQLETISTCLDIYTNWFITETNTPQVVKDKFEEYCNVAIGQISLLFSRRSEQSTPLIMIKYSEICLKAVDFLRKITQKLKKEESLRRVICVLIASIDDVCGPIDNLTTTIPMTQVIDVSTVLLYELWTKLATKENEMWGCISTCHKKWIRIREVAVNWSKYCNHFLTSFLEWMFKNNAQSKNVPISIQLLNETINVEYEENYCIRFWMRIIHFCGNPTVIPDNKVFSVVQQGIHDMINQILAYSTIEKYPNGNDLYNIFIDVLYQPVRYLNHMYYSDGIIIAMKSAINIFKTMTKTTIFNKQHYCKIIKIIESCMMSKSLTVTEMTMEAICKIYDENNQTFLILLQPIIHAITEIIEKSTYTYKLYTVKVIKEIQNYLNKTRKTSELPVMKKVGEEEEEKKVTYGELKKELFKNTLKAYSNEKGKGELLQECVKVMSKFIIDTTDEEELVGIINNVITTFNRSSDQITILLKTCPDDICDFLNIIVDYSALLPEQCNELIPMFEFLLKYIEYNLLQILSERSVVLINFFTKLYSVCYENITPTLFTKCNNIFNNICKYIPTNRSDNMELSFDITLYNNIRQYILPIPALKTPVDEKIMQEIFEEKQIDNYLDYIHIYTRDDSILTFIELPWMKNEKTESVLFIHRNYYGKESYLMNMTSEQEKWHLLLDEKEVKPYEVIEKEIQEAQWKKESEVSIEELMRNLEEGMKTHEKKEIRLKEPVIMEEQYKTQQEVLTRSGIERILMKIIGITDIENRYKTLLPNDELFAKLRELDEVSIKKTIEVELINEEEMTEEYLTFINGLGKVIQHPEGKQVLKYEANDMTIEYGNKILIESKTKKEAAIKVCWNNTIEKKENEIVISIRPTETELFVVESTKAIGLLETYNMINITSLSNIIRETILSYGRQKISDVEMYIKRHEIIEELGEYNKKIMPMVDCLFRREHVTAMIEQGFDSYETFSSVVLFNSFNVPASSPSPINIPKSKSPLNHQTKISQAPINYDIDFQDEEQNETQRTPKTHDKVSGKSKLSPNHSFKQEMKVLFSRKSSLNVVNQPTNTEKKRRKSTEEMNKEDEKKEDKVPRLTFFKKKK